MIVTNYGQTLTNEEFAVAMIIEVLIVQYLILFMNTSQIKSRKDFYFKLIPILPIFFSLKEKYTELIESLILKENQKPLESSNYAKNSFDKMSENIKRKNEEKKG